jgi:putative Mg2+ transporter-C (MgtC) family protein
MLNHLSIGPESSALFIKLLVALICGGLIGTERVLSHKAAGMRTYALVSMGAALFIIIGDLALKSYHGQGIGGIDPFHLPAAIITGIGFMGAGMIIFRETNVTGLTSASGFWVSAGIGMACGYGFFVPAFIATLLTLFVFIVLWRVERAIKTLVRHTDNDHSSNSKF